MDIQDCSVNYSLDHRHPHAYYSNREQLTGNTMQALEGKGEARTWLIPLLRQHVQQAHLAYWGSELLPLARALGSRAALAQQSPGRQVEAQQCRALELQLWNTLQSFCSWALDTSTAFR